MNLLELLSQLSAAKCDYALYFHRDGEQPIFQTTVARFKSASIIKVPILLAWAHLERLGEVSRDELCDLDGEEQVQGAGFSWLLKGRRIPFHDALLMMIATSDNLCTNLVIRRIGIERLQTIFESEFNLSHTRLERHLMDYAARQRGLDNWIGAQDGFRLFELLQSLPPDQRVWIDPMLLANQDAALLKRNILRDSIDFYHKTGSMGGVLHDWGFTTSARIFLFTSHIQDERALLPIFGAFGEWLTNSQNS